MIGRLPMIGMVKIFENTELKLGDMDHFAAWDRKSVAVNKNAGREKVCMKNMPSSAAFPKVDPTQDW